MKRIVAVLLALAFLAAGSLVAIAADKGPAEIKLEAKMGTVTFNHAAHQERVPDCKTCHHKGVEAGACRSCHDGTKAPSMKDAAHKLCKDCHKEKGGPTSCKDCHKK
jgi:predicted CXXCH cytochrome family protein